MSGQSATMSRKTQWALGLAIITAGVAFTAWRWGSAASANSVEATKKRVVAVQRAALGPKETEIVLPATLRGAQSTVVVAKATGYVHNIAVDLGSAVKAGALLATIDAREVSDELRVARARLTEAQENVVIATTTADRTASLGKNGAASPQDIDNAQASLNSARAAVASNSAQVARLQTLVQYQRVLAPYDGVVTQRFVDEGALAQGSVTQLFELSSVRALEAQLEAPQSVAGEIALGDKVTLIQPYSGAELTGEIARTAQALDPHSRTLRVEVTVPAAPGWIAGGYVRARIRKPRLQPPVSIPATALRVTSSGLQALVVSEEGSIEVRTLSVDRDLGREVELRSGIAAGEWVVLSPPADLETGAQVERIERAAEPAAQKPK